MSKAGSSSLFTPTAGSSKLHHQLRSFLLVFLSIACLPITTFFLIFSYFLRPHAYASILLRRYRLQNAPAFKPRRILVTGVGMTKGLFLARTFYLAGHTVIGADFDAAYSIPAAGRFSASIQKYVSLPRPSGEAGVAWYINALLRTVQQEKIDLWVSCSGVASAVEDGQAMEILSRRSNCKFIQFTAQDTGILHAKNSFIDKVKELGLPAPETHEVRSRDSVHKILHRSTSSTDGTPRTSSEAGPLIVDKTRKARRTSRQFILKSVDMDDSAREAAADMTILPRHTPSETYNFVANMKINEQKPWVLQQYVKGREYCTHALVVKGKVKAFVACYSSDLVMHYEALEKDDPLSQAMEQFTITFAGRMGAMDLDPNGLGSSPKVDGKPGDFTGHLSFDFLVEQLASEKGVECSILPIECNPRAHTAVALFEGKEMEITEAYLSALDTTTPDDLTNGVHGLFTQDEDATHERSTIVRPPEHPKKVYWIGHDLVVLGILPLLTLAHAFIRSSLSYLSYIPMADAVFNRSPSPPLRTATRRTIYDLAALAEHILTWQDGTYTLWDPLPAWWLYQVYWPGLFLRAALEGKKWSRVNVGTTKMFGC